MKSFPRWLIVVTGLSVLALIGGGYWFYLYQEQHLRQNSEANLQAATQLKVNQIAEWRSEQVRDAAGIMESSFLTEAVERFFANPQSELAGKILSRFRAMQELFHYRDVMLVDRDGQVRLSLSKHLGPLHEDAALCLAEALRARRPVLSDLHVGPADLPPHIDAVAPLFSETQKTENPVGAVIFQLDARQFLYPLTQFWPTPSRSAETLLVRRDGDAVLFLNDLRHQPDTALKLRIPLSRKEVPAVMAVLGKEGIVQGKDYRGVDVLSVLKAVPNSPWFMVAKVDEAEALSDWRFRSILILVLFIGLLAFLVTAVGMAWQKNGKSHYKELFLAEAALRRAEEGHRITLMSVGDGIISTDTDGRVDLVNPVAEDLTGWRQEEAHGKPLEEVFRIFNEETRQSVENPATKVLREGLVVGLANHTVLVAQDGTERPIADSAAPIRDEHGTIAGVVLVFRDQSKERASQRLFVQEKEKAQQYLDVAGVMLLALDTSGYVTMVNRKGCEILGYQEMDVSGKNWFEHFLPDRVRDEVKGVFSRIMDGRQEMDGYVENVVLTSSGETRVMAWRNSLLRDQDGSIIGTLSSGEDITDRKRAEAALTESAEKFRLLYEEAPVPYQSLDEEAHLLQVNTAWLQLLGYTCDEAIGKSFADFLTPRSQARFRETFLEFKRAGYVYGVEHEMVCKDKSIIDVSIDGRISRSEDGKFGHTHCVFQDITQRKRSEEALQESERRYRATFDTASVGIDLVDREGKFLEVNNTLSQFLGYAPEELRHLTILEVTHPEDVSRSREMHEAMIRGEMEGYRLEKRYVRKNGSILWADTAVSAIRDADGQYRATVGVIRDITQQKKSEEARIRLEAAVEQAAETVEITDPQGTIVYVNPTFERKTGYSREEAVGNNPRILKSGHHEDEFYKRMWDTITNGKIWTGHFINKKKDGTLFEEDVSISPVKDDSGKIVNYVAVKRDVTREVSLQRQLLQAQKMEAVGTLAGGIAHDFNNILQVALGYSELLLTGKSAKDTEYDDLQKIHHAARSGADLVRNLLTFSRKVEPKPVPMDLNNQVRNVEKLLHRTIPRMIDIRLELADDLKRINADTGQIEQIILNFAVNARDAMGEKGSLTIRTEEVVLDEEYCRSNVGAKPGDYVLLSVSDTGSGMDRETLQHIFEPFYTTKELGRGTGLGLAMVYGIVKQHGGHLTCYSEVGKGTTFRVYLPAILSKPEDVEESAAEMPAFGTETLLLVDDEDSLRLLGERILTKSGYTVLIAANGEEALALYTKKKEQISLVILDLIMPSMGGKDCLHELLKIDSTVKVLIASGYAANETTRECVRLGAKGFVPKPFRFKELLRAVRKTLDES